MSHFNFKDAKKEGILREENIVVRKAEFTDAESIAKFNVKIAEETEGIKIDRSVVLKGVEVVLKDPHRGFYLVAEKRNVVAKMVGQLMITFEWSDWRNKNFWWIQSVYVDKKYRNKKVFSRLYRRIVEMAKYREDVSGLRLYVEKHNKPAKQAYKALDMTKTPYEIYETKF